MHLVLVFDFSSVVQVWIVFEQDTLLFFVLAKEAHTKLKPGSIEYFLIRI